MLLYKSLVLPFLEYCCIVWITDQLGETKLLESVQRKATRMALVIPPDPRHPTYRQYPERLRMLNLITIEQRKTMHRLIFVEKLFRDPNAIPSLNDHIFRNSIGRSFRNVRTFTLPMTTLSVANRNPTIIMQNCYNMLHNIFTQTDSIANVKTKIKRHFATTLSSL